MAEDTEKDAGNPQDTDTTPEKGGKSAGVTFTQEQVDAMVKERVKREKAKYADYDDLKAKASKVDEYENASKSELEKAQEKAEALKRDNQALANSVNDKLKKAEVRIQAAQLGFTNPEDAYHLADLSAVDVDADGNVKGVDEALKELVKTKPYLLRPASERPAPPKTDAGTGNVPSTAEALTPGMEIFAKLAEQSGFKVDLDKVREYKANARLVTAMPQNAIDKQEN